MGGWIGVEVPDDGDSYAAHPEEPDLPDATFACLWVAKGLGVSWNTANSALLTEGRRVLIEDPDRFNGVAEIQVDERVWRHTRHETGTSP